MITTSEDVKLDVGNNIDIDAEVLPESVNVFNAEEIENKVKLTNELNNMSDSRRRRLIKYVQMNTLSEVLTTIKGGKNTTADNWKKTIAKLNGIKNLDAGDKRSKFDWKKLIETILPIIGTLAGLFLALREAERAAIESAEPISDDPDIMSAEKAAEECANAAKENIERSIVMKMCKQNEKGFSING